MMPDRPITVTFSPDQVSAIDCALTDRRHALEAALAEHPEAVTAYDRAWTAIEERLLDEVSAVLHAATVAPAAPAPSRREARAARRAVRPDAARSPAQVLPPGTEAP